MIKPNTSYNQKSYLFLYPVLNLKRNSLIKPKQTYVHSSEVDISDHTLIIEYDLSVETMRQFAKNWLYTNPLFLKQKGDFLFYFNLSPYRDDWSRFIKGEYSRFSKPFKTTVLEHYKSDRELHELVNSYLFPENHYLEYSDYYGVPVKTLREVGQLIDPPNLDREKYL
jgi:hypothetical protein